MEAVNAFNSELFSMIDMKPPISRAKMMSVTKSAIKAIKLYKHVVQIVEKFIKRCKPELKVPGLYVVDSIVRQSRHQFGLDKDVFGPRFLKNFTETFQNLYHCPEDDKNKILRVLNLWQKNGVFDMDIIQPLMDMANGVVAPAPSLEVPTEPQPPPTAAPVVATLSQMPTSDALAAVAQLFQSPHGQELQKMLQNLQQAEKTQTANNTNEPHPSPMPVAQPQMLDTHTEEKSSLTERLLDKFDYDDEPEDVATKVALDLPGQVPNMESVHPPLMGQPAPGEFVGGASHNEHQKVKDLYHSRNAHNSKSQVDSREEPSTRREGKSRRSRSGSRSPRRRRSRSSSRSRGSRRRRSRSPPREQRWRSRSQDRTDRERDRERRQKGLPSIKSQTLSVCSTTLWVGQLDKKTQQSDVMSLLEEFGQIDSINMIPPRGCAYIVMVHRQDAYTALNKLISGSYKVNQKSVKIAWALNKGIKTAHKKFWDVERGVTYIPWAKVKTEELEGYREGGMFDPDTLTEDWKSVLTLKKQAVVNGMSDTAPRDGTVETQIQGPAMGSIRSPPAFMSPAMMSPGSMHTMGGPVTGSMLPMGGHVTPPVSMPPLGGPGPVPSTVSMPPPGGPVPSTVSMPPPGGLVPGSMPRMRGPFPGSMPRMGGPVPVPSTVSMPPMRGPVPGSMPPLGGPVTPPVSMSPLGGPGPVPSTVSMSPLEGPVPGSMPRMGGPVPGPMPRMGGPVPVSMPRMRGPVPVPSTVSIPPLGGPLLPDFKPRSAAPGFKPIADMTSDPGLGKPADPELGSPEPAVMNLPPGPYHRPPPRFLPPQMMPGGPTFPRFRMRLPFPPRGPVLPRPPFMGPPEGPFRGRPPFRGPVRFPRGGW
ncbi:SR-related and CTD-associated factor 4-like [Entelurus aequoreus]|uniref:SR-related and CTD-associated factor 4-like n=1 Tax=Entelurus aequoreus TaxID=161455 RepID=UPI002B1D769A|nr:SR-related and CTD-associated factor 4-like [Entelurus aequoreus]